MPPGIFSWIIQFSDLTDPIGFVKAITKGFTEMKIDITNNAKERGEPKNLLY